MNKIKTLIAISMTIGFSYTANLSALQKIPPKQPCPFSKNVDSDASGRKGNGDFDGDHCIDQYEIIEGVIRVTFGKDGKMIGFLAQKNANPQHDYNTKVGKWNARDIDGDGKTDFEHDPELAHGRKHCWFSEFSRNSKEQLEGNREDGFKLRYDAEPGHSCEDPK